MRCYNEGVERLVLGARALGIRLSAEQVQRFQRYTRELLEWNRRVNLTAITDPAEVEVKHHLDSLSAAMALPPEVREGGRVVDVGAGGGFPGLPLKLAFPALRLALVESVRRKTAFLEHVVRALGLEGVEVLTGRAEELAHRPTLREGFDAALARGLAALPELLELTLPFCRVGGLVVAHKKGDIAAELAGAATALRELGGRLREVVPVRLEGLEDDRVLVVVEKVGRTPPRYPRRPGMPHKRPL